MAEDKKLVFEYLVLPHANWKYRDSMGTADVSVINYTDDPLEVAIYRYPKKTTPEERIKLLEEEVASIKRKLGTCK